MKHLRVGNSLDKCIDIGAIVDESQKKSIDEYVQDARNEGAEVKLLFLLCLAVNDYIMVVRTPGKSGIHLEFENSTWNTWKTWNSHEKS